MSMTESAVVAANVADSLDTLPTHCLQHIACAGGDLVLAHKLNSASHSLRTALSTHASEGNAAMQVWGPPMHGSASSSIVKFDAATLTLTKTARPGFPLVVFPGRLHTISALIELEIVSLEAIGGVQIGVLEADPRGKPNTDDIRRRVCFDGVGCVEAGLRVVGPSPVEARS
jgi:hypothetical protein